MEIMEIVRIKFSEDLADQTNISLIIILGNNYVKKKINKKLILNFSDLFSDLLDIYKIDEIPIELNSEEEVDAFNELTDTFLGKERFVYIKSDIYLFLHLYSKFLMNHLTFYYYFSPVLQENKWSWDKNLAKEWCQEVGFYYNEKKAVPFWSKNTWPNIREISSVYLLGTDYIYGPRQCDYLTIKKIIFLDDCVVAGLGYDGKLKKINLDEIPPALTDLICKDIVTIRHYWVVLTLENKIRLIPRIIKQYKRECEPLDPEFFTRTYKEIVDHFNWLFGIDTNGQVYTSSKKIKLNTGQKIVHIYVYNNFIFLLDVYGKIEIIEIEPDGQDGSLFFYNGYSCYKKNNTLNIFKDFINGLPPIRQMAVLDNKIIALGFDDQVYHN